MLTLKKILLHPASAVLVLVPFVNLIYFALAIVFVPAKKLFPFLFGITIGSAAVFYLLNRFIPTEHEFLKFYTVMALFSAAAYFLLRSILKMQSDIPKFSKARLVIGLALALAVCLTWTFATRSDALQPQTETMLQAIIDGDQEAFNFVSYGKELTLDAVQYALDRQGIILQGPIHKEMTAGLTVRGTRGDMVKIAEYIYRIGDEDYNVRITYRISNQKEGISEIAIRRN